MNVVVVTPPASVISLDEAKRHLRVDHDDEDALIAGMVAAATRHLASPQGWLGRSIGVQTLELRMCSFDAQCRGDMITLPFPPIVEVVSVTYADTEGVDQTVADTDWRIVGDRFLAPVYQGRWPAARLDHESVRIRYRAGYADAEPEGGGDPVRTVPEEIIAAILLHVGVLYENREAVAAGAAFSAIPPGFSAEALVWPFRIWSL